MENISEHQGTPYKGRRRDEMQRDVYTAELDYGASILVEGTDEPTIAEPVYTIVGAGQNQGGPFATNATEWRWGVGTNLRVAQSSIPALMRVLADLMEHDANA